MGLGIWFFLHKWSSLDTSVEQVCRGCGYQLFEDGTQRCPECGLENINPAAATSRTNSGRRVVGYFADLVLVAALVLGIYVLSAGLIHNFLPNSWRVLYYGAIAGGPQSGLLLQFSALSEPVSESDEAYEAFMAGMIAMPVDIHLWSANETDEFRLHLSRTTPQDEWQIAQLTAQPSDQDSEIQVTPHTIAKLIEAQPVIEVPYDSTSMLTALEAMLVSQWSTGEFQSVRMAYPNRGRPLPSGLYASTPYVNTVKGQNVTADRRVLMALIVVLVLGVIALGLLWHRRYHAAPK